MIPRRRRGRWVALALTILVLSAPGPVLAAEPGAECLSAVDVGGSVECVQYYDSNEPCKPGWQYRCKGETPGTYRVDLDSEGAQYWYEVCLKSTTSKATNVPEGGRACTGRMDGIAKQRNWTYFLTVDYRPGDTVEMDIEMWIDTSHSRTVNDIDLAGAKNCDITGRVSDGRFSCEEWKSGTRAPYTRPTPKAYTVNVNDPEEPVVQLLNFLAWMVSAAAVAGLLIAGMQMAMQLRRGVAGERASEYIRPLSLVCAACLLAATAGPIVEFLGFRQG